MGSPRLIQTLTVLLELYDLLNLGFYMSVSMLTQSNNRYHFENRKYRLSTTDKRPQGVLVFLHGASQAPLVETEAIHALRFYARSQNFVLLQPESSVGYSSMDNGGGSPTVSWNLRDTSQEFSFIYRLLMHVEQRLGLTFTERYALGYADGGSLMGSALQCGLGKEWSRVGIIAGGPVGSNRAPAMASPPTFIEVGLHDAWQLESSRSLRTLLKRLEPAPAYREIPDGHELSSQRLRRFLRWWDTSPTATVSHPRIIAKSSPNLLRPSHQQI